jgi:sugar/nucleoside kinase (ribokinase family)
MATGPRIVDTNGAGDAFVGGFLAALAKKHSLQGCCQAVGALSFGGPGGVEESFQDGIRLGWLELVKRIALW